MSTEHAAQVILVCSNLYVFGIRLQHTKDARGMIYNLPWRLLLTKKCKLEISSGTLSLLQCTITNEVAIVSAGPEEATRNISLCLWKEDTNIGFKNISDLPLQRCTLVSSHQHPRRRCLPFKLHAWDNHTTRRQSPMNMVSSKDFHAHYFIVCDIFNLYIAAGPSSTNMPLTCL